jgi:hypothetical protein
MAEKKNNIKLRFTAFELEVAINHAETLVRRSNHPVCGAVAEALEVINPSSIEVMPSQMQDIFPESVRKNKPEMARPKEPWWPQPYKIDRKFQYKIFNWPIMEQIMLSIMFWRSKLKRLRFLKDIRNELRWNIKDGVIEHDTVIID